MKTMEKLIFIQLILSVVFVVVIFIIANVMFKKSEEVGRQLNVYKDLYEDQNRIIEEKDSIILDRGMEIHIQKKYLREKDSLIMNLENINKRERKRHSSLKIKMQNIANDLGHSNNIFSSRFRVGQKVYFGNEDKILSSTIQSIEIIGYEAEYDVTYTLRNGIIISEDFLFLTREVAERGFDGSK